MGGNDLDQKKTSGQQHLTGDTIGSPGKATLVGAQEIGECPVSRSDPNVRPPEYVAMDPDCVRLLVTSLTTFRDFIGKTDPFWDLVDKNLSARQLQSFTQTITGARRAGLLPQIAQLVDIYNCGSSWGIHFKSQAAAPSGWGKDYPQNEVRKEHDNTKHVWYRQPSGPGNSGMHLGTQEEGEGTTNLHWDPSNPMDHVSEGTDGKNNPLLSMMPNPFKKSAPVEDALVPKGCAVYNPKALLTHADDIGWIDKHAPMLKRFVPAHAANGGPNSSTEPFYTLSQMAARAGKAKMFANWELDRKAQMVNQPRGIGTANHLLAAANAVEKHEQSSRSLAVKERTPETEPARVALATALEPLLDDMYNATTGFFSHLHSEVGETPANWGKDDLIKMGDEYWKLQDAVFEVHKRRQDKKAGG